MTNSLNAADPLAQLKDIHLPEPISWWPPAIGWWLSAALILTVIICVIWGYKHWQKSAYRRIAIREIDRLFGSQPTSLASDLNQLLKSVAQQSYSTLEVSRLSAREWLEFLDNSANMQAFNSGSGQILATAPYEKNPTIDNPGELKKCCIQWIRRHK